MLRFKAELSDGSGGSYLLTLYFVNLQGGMTQENRVVLLSELNDKTIQQYLEEMYPSMTVQDITE